MIQLVMISIVAKDLRRWMTPLFRNREKCIEK